MPTKQDIDKGVAINMGGTVPGGHGLAPIRQGLLDEPRERQWVIGQVVNNSTKIEHPAEADDKQTPCMVFVDMTGITDTADCDQLAAMANRARAKLMGQRTFDEVDADEEATPGDEVPDDDQADSDADGGSPVDRHFARVTDGATDLGEDDESMPDYGGQAGSDGGEPVSPRLLSSVPDSPDGE